MSSMEWQTSHNGMQIPSSHELLDFDTFASVMSAAPLDDLHKYLDSDDEQDLEYNYDGDSEDEEHSPLGLNAKENQTQAPRSLCSNMDINDNTDTGLDDISDATSDTISDSGTPYTWIDERLDIDKKLLQPSHAASHHLDPELQSTIDRTEVVLEQLSTRAQLFISEQPLSTQIVLANKAKDEVLRPYGKYGSQARFSESVMRYLSGGDTVRRPGKDGMDRIKDGKLRFAALDPNICSNSRREDQKLKRKATNVPYCETDGSETRCKVSRDKKHSNYTFGRDAHSSILETDNTGSDNESDTFGNWSSFVCNPAPVASTEGPQAFAGSLSFRKTSGPHDFVHEVIENATQNSSLYSLDAADLELKPDEESCSNAESDANLMQDTCLLGSNETVPPIYTASNDTIVSLTPLATTFSNVHLKTPTTSTFSSTQPSTSFASSSTYNQQPSTPNYSCSVSPKHNQLLARESYNPISLKFTWPATLRSSGAPCMPTPGLLDAINRIVHLHNAEARFMLSYYVRKYDTPAHFGGSAAGKPENEPPHALFRLGIAQYVMSKVGKIVEHKERDELGLTPEARRVLGQVWEAHPSTHAWFDDSLQVEDTNEKFTGYDEDHFGDEDIIMVTDTPFGASLSYPSRSGQKPELQHKTRLTFRGGLNPLEKAILARACNITVETVDAYWENMREETKAWGAMKLWCTARDAEMIARVKSEGRW